MQRPLPLPVQKAATKVHYPDTLHAVRAVRAVRAEQAKGYKGQQKMYVYLLHVVLPPQLKFSKAGLSTGENVGPSAPLAKKRRLQESESDADYGNGEVSLG